MQSRVLAIIFLVLLAQEDDLQERRDGPIKAGEACDGSMGIRNGLLPLHLGSLLGNRIC